MNEESWNRVREFDYSTYDIDRAEWDAQKPHGISGCFRVKDDAEFLYRAVTSHLPYLAEAVIVLQPSDRETYRVIAQLSNLPKVRVVNYPLAPVFVTDDEWASVPENSIHSFVYLSNYAVSRCMYSWVAQIEADVICLSTFAKIVQQVNTHKNEKALYGRYLLNVAGEKMDQVSKTVPRNGGWDEKVFPNHPDYHYIKKPKYEVITSPYKNINTGWSGLHMKRCKKDKIGWNDEKYTPFDPEHVAAALRAFNVDNAYVGPDNPEGEPCLFEVSL